MKWTNFGRILAFWIYCAPWVGAESHFSLAGEQKFLPTQLGQGWAKCISLGDSTQQLTQHWDKEQQSKAQNSDSKYRQMALIGFDT